MALSASAKANNDFGIEEENKELQITFLFKLKSSLFGVYSKLLKNRKCPRLLGIGLVIIMQFQILHYILEIKNYACTNDSVYQFVYSVTKYFSISSAFSLFSLNGYVLYLGSIIGTLSCIYAICLGCGIYSISEKEASLKSKFPSCSRIFLIYLSYLFYYVLFSPGMDTFLALFNCSGIYMPSQTDVKCWGSTHIIMICIFAPTLLLFFCETMIISILFNEYMPDKRDSLARMNEYYLETIQLLFKIILSTLSQYWLYQTWDLPAVPLLISEIPLLYFVYLYKSHLQFYSYSVSLIYSSGVGISLWFTLFLLIEEVSGRVAGGLVMLLGSILIPFCISLYRSRIIRGLIYEERYDQIKNDQLIAIYSETFLDYYKNQGTNTEIQQAVVGYFSKHFHECYVLDCPLRMEESLYVPATGEYRNTQKPMAEDPVTQLHLLKATLNVYTKKTNASASIHAFFSIFLLTHMGNIPKAATEMASGLTSETSFQEEFCLFRARQRIESVMKKRSLQTKKENGKNSDNFDVRLAIRYEELTLKLEKAIMQIANEYVEFWSILEGTMPDLDALHTKGVEIMTQSKELDNIWSQIRELNDNNKKVNALYGTYVRELKNDKEEGEILLEKERNFGVNQSGKHNQAANYELMFAEDTGIIITNSAGIIIKVNLGATKLFSYSSYELIGQDCQLLMPQIVGKSHAKLVDLYMKTGRERILRKERDTIALHRFGNIFPIFLIIKPVPCLKDGVQFIAFLRSHEKGEHIVLTDFYGKIELFSTNFGEFIGITPQQLKNHEIYIQLLFPSLAESDQKKKNTFLDKLQSENKSEGTTIDLELHIPRALMDIFNKTVVQDKKVQDQSIFERVTDYATRVGDVTRYRNEVELNLMKKTVSYEDCDIEKKVKGKTWLSNFGDGLVLMRLFKFKICKLDKQTKEDVKPISLRHSHMNVNRKALSSNYRVPLDKPNMHSRFASDANNFALDGKFPEFAYEEEKEGPSKIIIQEISWSNPEEETDNNDSISASRADQLKDKVDAEGLIIQELRKERQKDVKDKKVKIKEQLDGDQTSSTFQSKAYSLTKQIRSMRNYVHQKVTPTSIKNLNIAANVVFATLLVLTIIFYVTTNTIFVQLKSNFYLLRDAKTLIYDIFTITSMTRQLIYVQPGSSQLINPNSTLHGDMNSYLLTNINGFAGELQSASKNLGAGNLNGENKICTAIYNNVGGFPNKCDMDVISCVSAFVSHSYRINNISQSERTSSNPSFSFILLNGFNNILGTVNNTCTNIANDSSNSKDSATLTIAILLSVASFSLFVSVLVLIPVTISVNKSRGEIVMMFTEIPLAKIKEEVEKCRQYSSQLHSGEEKSIILHNEPNKEQPATVQETPIKPATPTPEEEKKDSEEGSDEEKDVLNEKFEEEKIKKEKETKVHARRFKPFKNPILSVILRLLLLMLVLESYFIIVYFMSSDFLGVTLNFTNEQLSIYTEEFSNAFALRAIQEEMCTNMSSKIFNSNPQFLSQTIDQLLNIDNNLLTIHLSNEGRHYSTYNNLFQHVLYDDMCTDIYQSTVNITKCETDVYSIMKKGLHDASVSFWELLRTNWNDFLEQRNPKTSLNDPRIITSESLVTVYFSLAYQVLTSSLEAEIEDMMNSQNNYRILIFVIYLLTLLIISILWQIFISATNDKLYNTRTILAIIPPDTIREIHSIRDYLVNTSKMLFSAGGN